MHACLKLRGRRDLSYLEQNVVLPVENSLCAHQRRNPSRQRYTNVFELVDEKQA